jgi:hypothetical protein
MRAESQNYINSLQNCKSLAERKRINDEFSIYYGSLDVKEKEELNPYFDNLKNTINQKIEKLDILANKAESILDKFLITQV